MAIGWQKGIHSQVFFPPKIPAVRATSRASPLGPLRDWRTSINCGVPFKTAWALAVRKVDFLFSVEIISSSYKPDTGEFQRLREVPIRIVPRRFFSNRLLYFFDNSFFHLIILKKGTQIDFFIRKEARTKSPFRSQSKTGAIATK